MKHINYFDLGLGPYPHELEFMVKHVFPSIPNISYNAYGIEAHPSYVNTAKEIFKNNNNVEIFNFAISNKKDTENLYLQENQPDGGIGNSIFSSKYNVDKNKYIKIPSDTFSSFINDNNIDLNDSLNILKVNIEGAELYLWEDLKINNIRNKFQILCGYKDHDIFKVSELKPKYDYYMSLVEELNINLLHFCHYGGQTLAINNMKNAINQKLSTNL
jgi:FkbM family methyltransferase